MTQCGRLSGFLIAFSCLMLIAVSVFAEDVTFIKEYTYQASEADSKLSSRTIALEQVKRLLLEELGTYLESETVVKEFKLTKDQVTALTAGVVSTEIMNEKWDGKSYYLKAKITADPTAVAKSIDALRKDRDKTRELEELRKKADSALQEIEKLKKELDVAKGENKEQKQKEYGEAIEELNTTALFEKAHALLWEAGHYKEAIAVFAKIIEIDPKSAKAYAGHAIANYALDNKQEAFSNIDKAIELEPKYGWLYGLRGEFYSATGNYQEAIINFDKWTALEPNMAVPHIGKGEVYSKLKNYQEAIRAYDKAIEIDPKNAEAFGGRAYVYYNLGNKRKALSNINKAIEINPEYGALYHVRIHGELSKNEETEESNNIPEKGDDAIDVMLRDLDGKTIKLSQFHGKVVMLYFWATWCQPCREEMPSMYALYNKFKRTDLVMLPVSIDDFAERIRDFMKKNNYIMPVYHDVNLDAESAYGITGIPETFIINKNGIVAEKIIGPLDWMKPDVVQAIQEMLK